MKRIIITLFIFFLAISNSFASDVMPDYLTPAQTPYYETVNETVAVIFNRIKTYIRTSRYPKYFNDFALIKNDDTQTSTYKYVYNSGAELMYGVDTNELKYISFRRPELQKCRIMYDYPSGRLHAIQIFTEDGASFVFSSDGKYVDYAPYVKKVNEKVKDNWQVPPRKNIEEMAKGQKDLLVQTAVTVNRDGTIKKIIILKSSHIRELDKNAIATIKRAAPFDEFPEDFFNNEITITLNFNFSL